MPDQRPQQVLKRLRALLESRSASFWTMGAWIALTLVWVIPFQVTGQPAATVRAIAEDWLVFRIVYASVGLTTVLCAATRLSRDIRRLQTSHAAASPTSDAVAIHALSMDSARTRLTAHGFDVNSDGEALYAVKNRSSLLGGSVFHLGIVLIGLSLVGHLMTVESVNLRVTEGQSFAEAATAAGVAGLPARVRGLTLESIRPSYYEDVLLFTRLEARVKDVAGKQTTLSLSHPLWAEPTVVMSIGDYNLAPHIEVADFRGDQPIPTEYVVAMNLSPGTEDSADIPELPLDISLIAYPDHGVVDGRDVSLSYNIANPAFLLAVSEKGRNGALLARQLVKIGEKVNAGDYIVSIKALSRYGTFRITKAPALPFMALGWLVATLGVAWRYLLRRETVMVWASDEGLLVDGWLDLGGRAVGRRRALALLTAEEES